LHTEECAAAGYVDINAVFPSQRCSIGRIFQEAVGNAFGEEDTRVKQAITAKKVY
jgi:hypothetical protein